MVSNINRLGNIIKAARTTKHMTQGQLPSEVGITTRHLRAIEQGNRKPSYELLFSIVRKLEISANHIFYPECGTSDPETERLRTLLALLDVRDISLVITELQSMLEQE